MNHTATYSPEDNKLRLYVGRVPRSEYEALRAAGYVSTPKQDCDFVATWTPDREDLALSYLEADEDIGDEDYSPEERAADKAERFEGYRDKRRDEAGGHADTFDAGPSAFGHQNRNRAERQAARHDRFRTRAVSQWSKAEYWQTRTAGVIAHALYKSSAPVRRSRILRLEAEQRKHDKSREEYAERFAAWSRVAALDGAEEPIKSVDGQLYGKPAAKLAYTLANSSSDWRDYKHPRRDLDESKYNSGKTSLYSLMTDAEDSITANEAAALWFEGRTDPTTDDESNSARWSRHYELRLTYERAMLAEEGGTVAEADMEPGGWIHGGRGSHCLENGGKGWRQIQKVNKSPATGRAVSVQVWGTWTGFTAESDYKQQATKPHLVTINVERLGENCYRAPTDEERAAFAEQKKATKAPPVSIINPTDDDATRFQLLLNERAAFFAKQKGKMPPKPRPIERITQATFSRYSGADSIYHITQFTFSGVTFKVRMRQRGFCDYNAADSVTVLTDKPQKPLPLDWEKAFAEYATKPVEPAEPVAAGQLF